MTPAEGFAPATTHLLDCAAAVCAAHGTQLTPVRRAVLGLVIDSARPAGAYDVLRRMAERQGPTAPPTVYRALDFLLAEGLIHKIERLSAFVACTHHLRHEHDHPAHGANLQFLICSGCGRAIEMEDAGVRSALQAAAGRAGFALRGATIEADGLCAACAATHAA